MIGRQTFVVKKERKRKRERERERDLSDRDEEGRVKICSLEIWKEVCDDYSIGSSNFVEPFLLLLQQQ